MKKILASSIVATAILAPQLFPVSQAQANTSPATANTQDIATPIRLANKTIDIKLTPENLKAMKDGRYYYNAIGVGSYLGEVPVMYGKPRIDQIIRDYEDGKTLYGASYGKGDRLGITAEAKRVYSNASLNEMRITEMHYDATGKGILKKDVEKTLGQATYSEGSIKGTKDIFREYGKNLTVYYERHETTNAWVVSTILMKGDVVNGKPARPSTSGLALQNKEIDLTISKTPIQKMKDGSYKLYNTVGLGTPLSEVRKTFGLPKYDIIQRTSKLTEQSLSYGKYDELTINATAYGYKENGQLDKVGVSEMVYDMKGDGISKNALEKYAGKPTAYDGSTKLDYISREYGEHLEVDYMKDEDTSKFKADVLYIHTKEDKDENHVYNYNTPVNE